MLNKHIFSIYSEEINKEKNEVAKIYFIESKSKDLIHRINNILRLKENDEIILFDTKNVFRTKIVDINKKRIKFEIVKSNPIKKQEKQINAYIPILDKKQLEEAFCILGQQGVNEIFFVKFEKDHNRNINEHQIERLKKALIAGCEQGKQFVIPKINENIIPFETMIEIIKSNNETLFYFDKTGKLINDIVQQTKSFKKNISFTCGPEAGFSKREIELLKDKVGISLSSYTLRSIDTVKFATIFFRAII
jgi:RsmE family RNA methyltransferase